MRLSVAVLPPLAATCAPLAELSVSVLVVCERSDMSRLSVAEPPPLAATCAPLADVVVVERLELSVLVLVVVVDRSALSVFVVERSALS